MNIAKDWLGEIAADPDAVRDFCNRHNLADAASVAFDVAARAFPGSKISLAVESDWDSDAQWLEVVVETPQQYSTDESVRSTEEFCREWGTYPDAAARGLIVLYFYPAES